MEDQRYEALAKRSRVIHGQKHVLPTAVWLLEANHAVVKAPEVGRGLQGRLQSTARLCKIGAMKELPHPGPPQPKIFELHRDHAYWPFVAATAVDAAHEYDASEASARRS
jgi:hypothetical protein